MAYWQTLERFLDKSTDLVTVGSLATMPRWTFWSFVTIVIVAFIGTGWIFYSW
jgi:hypothetical protein